MTLSHALRAERVKLNHSPIWLAFVLIPLFPAFFGTVNYMLNIFLLKSTWYSLWTQHTLFSAYFFFPALIGIYCSYLWRLEHSDHNWNAVMTAPIPFIYTYLSKLFSAVVMVLLSLVWMFVLFLVCGKACGIAGNPPWKELIEWFVCGFAGSIVICAIQLFLSLLIRSFSVPVGISLMGGILGLAMTAKGWGFFNPYALFALGIKANNPTRILDYGSFSISCILFFVLFTILSIWYLTHRDTKTG